MTTPEAWQQLPSRSKELFGLEPSRDELAKLASFLDLLETWSERMNLVGPGSREELIDRHLLDSIAPAGLLGPAAAVVDFGSGAGFPAIPLAVVLPAVRFHLVESRRKRCSFLRHVARTLQLTNVTVWESRGEEWKPGEPQVKAVLGRALSVDKLAELASGVLPVGGRLIVMRKQGASVDLHGFREVCVRRYRLPRGERHEVVAFERS